MKKNLNKREINIPILTRVEGEGALNLQIEAGKITRLELAIYEPPRLFEKILEGREPNEVVDAVARICGICPVAYQMSAVHAIESCFDMAPGEWVRNMRRLFYCGEWIESHSIHVYMLAAPDFLGYSSMTDMARDYPDIVRDGMKIHSLGTRLMALLGKRAVHPVGACVGGFYHAPSLEEVHNLLVQFETCLPLAEALIPFTAKLNFPKAEHEFTAVSLHQPSEYPINEGRIQSSSGLDIDISEYMDFFQQHQVAYSTAQHSTLSGKTYLTGPLARINLNYKHIPKNIQRLLKKNQIHFPSTNMFHSIVARAVEIYYAMIESIRLMRLYVTPPESRIKLTAKAGNGYGCTEAPRGILWHYFEFAETGLVKRARIIAPTSQNLSRIEEDLRHSLEEYGLDRSDDDLRYYSEKIIRNYDPCISCATHFLRLKIERVDSQL
ncbi:MAG: Ni/Fe hydrogenase subunit alpha [Legionellales bacterium]|nr:Ni/Fe hydrogenase subunit alpha [Legionellales bacterium]